LTGNVGGSLAQRVVEVSNPNAEPRIPGNVKHDAVAPENQPDVFKANMQQLDAEQKRWQNVRGSEGFAEPGVQQIEKARGVAATKYREHLMKRYGGDVAAVDRAMAQVIQPLPPQDIGSVESLVAQAPQLADPMRQEQFSARLDQDFAQFHEALSQGKPVDPQALQRYMNAKIVLNHVREGKTHPEDINKSLQANAQTASQVLTSGAVTQETLRAVLQNPDGQMLANRVAQTQAQLDGTATPAPAPDFMTTLTSMASNNPMQLAGLVLGIPMALFGLSRMSDDDPVTGMIAMLLGAAGIGGGMGMFGGGNMVDTLLGAATGAAGEKPQKPELIPPQLAQEAPEPAEPPASAVRPENVFAPRATPAGTEGLLRNKLIPALSQRPETKNLGASLQQLVDSNDAALRNAMDIVGQTNNTPQQKVQAVKQLLTTHPVLSAEYNKLPWAVQIGLNQGLADALKSGT
jgi:hypothetical protein